MKFDVIVLFDKKTATYLPPMTVTSIPGAVRDLQEIINSKPADAPVWAKHPTDFDLYLLCYWDNESGKYEFDTAAHSFQVNLGTLLTN